MSKIINPNEPQMTEEQQAIVAIVQQIRDLTAAVLVLQRDVKDLKEIKKDD